ncbi:TrkH family potassium uptake protein [uncultured Phascolarctobacterium sp.]|jgi:trk system potassium uptake protein TrkH|uniref:TrkH family potassium uptake protein n=1 Tax=uncultured Phascolarctobacterium sp. TaxID=512296 RepID=UPI0025F58C15|nr:TrkH family potassium uptake protein [uncultured Phascolarctobacterium sp.]
MDIKIIIFLLSKIASGIAIAQVLPLFLTFCYGEDCYTSFIFSIATALLFSFACKRYCGDADAKDLSVREGIAAVFFSWILAALLAGLPYCFEGLLDPASAYFESMSGLTTTGATAIANLDIVPRSIIIWRTMTHWIGGIGIIVLFVALLPQIAGSAVYLFNAEVSGFSNSRILPRIRTTAVALIYIYLLLTIILTGILAILGMNTFDAVNHACSTIATGGFSNYNNSVGHFQSASIEIVLGFFMILAAGNFALYYQVTQVGLKVLWQDLEFKSYLFMMFLFTLLVAANIIYVNDYPVQEGLVKAFFQVTSFGSTTGYVSCDYDQWPSFAKLIMAICYFTGGCAGSTAGGIKICRFIVLLKTVAAELRHTLHPQMLPNIYYNKKRLPTETIINVSRFFFMYILVVAVLSLVITLGGMPVDDAVFGVASCVSSVGPAFGSIGATSTYADVSHMGKLALALAMLLGRLELFTVLALLRKEYWRSSKRW